MFALLTFAQNKGTIYLGKKRQRSYSPVRQRGFRPWYSVQQRPLLLPEEPAGRRYRHSEPECTGTLFAS